VAARQTQAPVRWRRSSSRGFSRTISGAAIISTKAELALDAKGKFLGIRVS